jgi:membrane protein
VLAGEAMLAVALAFDDGGEPPDAGDVAARCRGTPEEVGEVLGTLRSAGLVVAATEGGLLPSRPLERITLLDVRKAVLGPVVDGSAPSALVGKIVKEIEDQAAERLAETSFRDLVARARREGISSAVRAVEADEDGPAAGPTVA